MKSLFLIFMLRIRNSKLINGLYRFWNDSKERHNIASKNKSLAMSIRRKIQKMKVQKLETKNIEKENQEKIVKRLQSLGYF